MPRPVQRNQQNFRGDAEVLAQVLEAVRIIDARLAKIERKLSQRGDTSPTIADADNLAGERDSSSSNLDPAAGSVPLLGSVNGVELTAKSEELADLSDDKPFSGGRSAADHHSATKLLTLPDDRRKMGDGDSTAEDVESEVTEDDGPPFAVTFTQKVCSAFDADIYTPPTPAWLLVSKILQVASFSVIIVSCTSFCAETMPVFVVEAAPGSEVTASWWVFRILEIICISYFTVEYLVRLLCFPPPRRHFFKSFMNWIDLLGIAPFYIHEIVRGLGKSDLAMDWFIILRVLRLTRVLKLSRHSSGMKDLGETITISLDAFSLTFFILVTGIVIFSSVMFYVEQGEGAFFDYNRAQWMRGEHATDFQSIPGTFWWCIVTLTTVGYGEVVPFTSLGKCVGAITMLAGIFTIAFPTMILSVNFQEVRDRRKEAKEREAQRMRTMSMRSSMNMSNGSRNREQGARQRMACMIKALHSGPSTAVQQSSKSETQEVNAHQPCSPTKPRQGNAYEVQGPHTPSS